MGSAPVALSGEMGLLALPHCPPGMTPPPSFHGVLGQPSYSSSSPGSAFHKDRVDVYLLPSPSTAIVGVLGKGPSGD